MSILEQQASRNEYLDSVLLKSDSRNSQKQAINAFKKWDHFLNSAYDKPEAEIIAELKRMQAEPEFYQFLNRFVQFMVSQSLSRNSINGYFNQIKGWLRFNAIRVHNDDVKQFVRFPKLIKETKKPLTIDMIRTLLSHNTNNTMRALLLVLMSSGLRLNEALQLRYQDVDDRGFVRVRAATTKTRQERQTIMSPEALDAIGIIKGDKTDFDYIFVEKWHENSDQNFEIAFRKLRKKAGFTAKYDNGRMYQLNLHSFRSFFITQATRATDGDTAHALAGHGGYLDQYLRLTNDEKLELYTKLTPYLAVSNETKLRDQNQKLASELEKRKALEIEMQKMQDKMARMEESIKHYKKDQ